jgi:GrpB-like predicted nucleotidyltransferase (UPF0157 family)
MTEDESLQQAIHQPIQIVAYDPAWPQQFEQEKSRLAHLFPQLIQIEHVGSTAVPGLDAKPVIDIYATVASMEIADRLLPALCENGYVTSAEFNATLGNRRWLMRHANGRRTHHLHLVVSSSEHWQRAMRFRDQLRSDPALALAYVALKRSLAERHASDREAYTQAKTDFIHGALKCADR